ncbi:hypothetical protein M885DRAFT_516322 [Pelagophyceae sp. CCMP2097]|nr:hypothetical protein M885DRAFT_516322 [Pelagophyceae sp. CCMP2097]
MRRRLRRQEHGPGPRRGARPAARRGRARSGRRRFVPALFLDAIAGAHALILPLRQSRLRPMPRQVDGDARGRRVPVLPRDACVNPARKSPLAPKTDPNNQGRSTPNFLTWTTRTGTVHRPAAYVPTSVSCASAPVQQS